MKNQSRKARLAAGVAVAVIAAPGVALASHVFDDVADDRFFAEPVEWAADNEITTGVSPTMFAPDDPVTRGESVTFLKRYEDNVVAPRADAIDARADGLDARADALETRAEDIEADIDVLMDEQAAAAVNREQEDIQSWDGEETLTRTLNLNVPADGYLVMTYTATIAKANSSGSIGAATYMGNIDVAGTNVASTLTSMDLTESRFSTFQTISVTHMETVEAGLLTVAGDLRETFAPADARVRVYDQTLSVIFVPNQLSLQNGIIEG